MKIAFVIGVNDVGGAEFVSYHHVLMAYRNGLEVIVLSGTGGKFYNLIKAAGIPIEIVGMNPAKEAIAPLLTGCKVVFNCNAFGATAPIIKLKQEIGFKYLTIIHSDINWVYDQLLKYDGWTDGYYAIHQKIVEAFAGKGTMNREKFMVIPNCVDVGAIGTSPDPSKGKGEKGQDREAIRAEYGYKKTDFVIGMITRISADKNVIDALKILEKLPDQMNARLLIIGGAASNQQSENYYGRFNRLLKTMRFGKYLNRVKVTGNLPLEEVYRSMLAFDIGLNCSPSEGLPIALLEMMAAGITCVMPGIGDIPDVLTGRGVVVPIKQRLHIKDILVEPCYTTQEINLFANAVKEIAKDRPALERMGKDAADYVQKFRSMEVQEKLFLKFIGMGKKTKRRTGDGAMGADCRATLAMTGDGATGRTGALATRRNGENANAAETDCRAKLAMTLPIVSVLMPVRDGNMEWIKEAVESIFAQDYKGKMELVVVNHDCRLSLSKKLGDILSGDKTMRAFSLLIEDETLEFSEVLDRGVVVCEGEIIVRMDCDDIAEPNLVSGVVDFMQTHPEFDVCGVQLQFFGAKNITTHHPATIDRRAAYEMAGTWFVNHPGAGIRKAVLQKVGGYGKTKTGFAEDYHLWCKILKAGGVIANMRNVLMNYRCYGKEWRYPAGYQDFLAKEREGLKQ